MHLQEGEGTRAAMFCSLFPEPALLLSNSNALNYTLDQHPVGVGGGYTWASHYFKQILAVSAKVTNGLNADGSEILFDSTKNSKDYWFDADYWFGPDGGVTFMTLCTPRRTRSRTRGCPIASSPTGPPSAVRRLRQLPVLRQTGHSRRIHPRPGRLAGHRERRRTDFTTNGFRGEVDYYFVPGFAVMGRYDRLNQTIAGTPTTRSPTWGVGAEKALTNWAT